MAHITRIVEKHPAAIRWMHWLNFPLLVLMIWSGLMIYWADSLPGAPPGQSADHQVYRIGIGSFTLIRLFPDSFYHLFRIEGHLTRGIAFHAFFMGLFALNGLAYVLFLAISGQWRSILPDLPALRAFPSALRAELTSQHAPHPGKKYNPAQRLAYTAVLGLGAGSLLTGVAIWKPSSLSFITTLCGGYETARWLHFWITLAFCAFFLIHVAQVLRSGWNTLRSMIMGAEIAGAEIQSSVRPAIAQSVSPDPSPSILAPRAEGPAA